MTICHICEENIDDWNCYLQQCLKLLKEYSHLLEALILDFYVEDLWSKVKPSWQSSLNELSPAHLAALLDTTNPINRLLPLSLLAFRSACKACSLPRRPVESAENIHEFIQKCSGIGKCSCSDQNPFLCSRACDELSKSGGQSKFLESHFRLGVKPKKQHEIVRMAWVLNAAGNHRKCTDVVDVGSGKGHLARIVAYKHAFRVTCLEINEKLVEGARKCDEKLEKKLKSVSVESPQHIALPMTLEVSPLRFSEVVNPIGNIILTTLHGCGDLSTTLLRLFVSSENIKALAVVGCCYMKLSTNDSNNGYPISSAMKYKYKHNLSYVAREAACHAVEMYHQRLTEEEQVQKLKIHSYRAALEKVLIEKDCSLKHLGLHTVNNGHELSFEEYAHRAVSKLPIQLESQELVCPSISDCLSSWRKVVIFYVLRIMIAPVIETVLLLDRLLYLYENGINCALIPAFDPVCSPRNSILLGIKR